VGCPRSAHGRFAAFIRGLQVSSPLLHPTGKSKENNFKVSLFAPKFALAACVCRLLLRRLSLNDEVGSQRQQVMLAGCVPSLSASTAHLKPVCAAQVSSLRGVRGPARVEFPFVSEHHIGTIAGELPAPLPLLLSLHHRAGCLG
jgi:hypothetical protein